MRKTYAGREIDVSFDPEVCQHAGECVRGLPLVFDAKQRPWIQPEHASLDEIESVIDRCPSLALKFERRPVDD